MSDKDIPDLRPSTTVEYELYERYPEEWGAAWMCQDTATTLKAARATLRAWRVEDKKEDPHGAPSEYCIVKVTTTKTRDVRK